jgi:hypothetical protein
VSRAVVSAYVRVTLLEDLAVPFSQRVAASCRDVFLQEAAERLALQKKLMHETALMTARNEPLGGPRIVDPSRSRRQRSASPTGTLSHQVRTADPFERLVSDLRLPSESGALLVRSHSPPYAAPAPQPSHEQQRSSVAIVRSSPLAGTHTNRQSAAADTAALRHTQPLESRQAIASSIRDVLDAMQAARAATDHHHVASPPPSSTSGVHTRLSASAGNSIARTRLAPTTSRLAPAAAAPPAPPAKRFSTT